MKILVHGYLEFGTHTQQRAFAIGEQDGITMLPLQASGMPSGFWRRLASRLAWRMGWPLDFGGDNAALLAAARELRPDAILVDNLKGIRSATLRKIRDEVGAVLAYLSPDDVVANHNMSEWLRRSLPLWDLFFTTKTFNVEELRRLGARRPVLIGNIYTPSLHRPLTPGEVGPEFEAFDLVFVGQYEKDRADSLRKLAQAGFNIVVYGPDAGLVEGGWSALAASAITVRPAVWGEDYVKAAHHGKAFLGFLRKKNRDRITQRSIEVPAMARPLLAEKTEEHDAHLVDGAEYVGFSSEGELIAAARALLDDAERRRAVGEAGRRRCLESGYDVGRLAQRIVAALDAARQTRGPSKDQS